MKAMMVATGTTDLSYVLVELGVDVRRAGDKEISGCCPVHLKRTGHVDRSPSWSMNAQTGLWICYSCGAKGTLSSLVSDLTGTDQSVIEVHKFLIEAGLKRLNAKDEVEEQPEVDWVSYSQFRDVPVNLLQSRSLAPNIARLHGIKWDVTNRCWVIPIVAPTGELLGWQSKKKGWVRNYPIGVKKSETLFGIERFTSDTAVLVESPLDVVRFASLGLKAQCLSSFGAFVSKQQIDLLSAVAKRVIIAMDNDEAGLEANKRLFKTLPRFTGGTFWINYKHTYAKDIGEMDDDEIRTAIDGASVMPGWIM
jgi:5S rRNA maturation endonuclease (ribonuclease M5)